MVFSDKNNVVVFKNGKWIINNFAGVSVEPFASDHRLRKAEVT
jgi:hypothetical protein